MSYSLWSVHFVNKLYIQHTLIFDQEPFLKGVFQFSNWICQIYNKTLRFHISKQLHLFTNEVYSEGIRHMNSYFDIMTYLLHFMEFTDFMEFFYFYLPCSKLLIKNCKDKRHRPMMWHCLYYWFVSHGYMSDFLLA